MAPNASNLIIILSIMLFFTTTISAFNITRLLDNYPDFSTYNDLLTQTGVASEVNKHRTITVLVVDNSAMGPISSKPQSTITNILKTHIIADYYDTMKLSEMKSSEEATTLFQSTGVAYGKQGFLNISKSDGEVAFGSNVKGAPHDAKIVKSVAAQPYNISVIQISKPIIAPGLDQTASSGSPKASPPTRLAPPPPKKSTKSEAPSPGPAADEDAADAPDAESPAEASGPSPSPAPEGDEADKEPPAKEAPPDKKNSGVQLTVDGAMVVACLGLLLLLS